MWADSGRCEWVCGQLHLQLPPSTRRLQEVKIPVFNDVDSEPAPADFTYVRCACARRAQEEHGKDRVTGGDKQECLPCSLLLLAKVGAVQECAKCCASAFAGVQGSLQQTATKWMEDCKESKERRLCTACAQGELLWRPGRGGAGTPRGGGHAGWRAVVRAGKGRVLHPEGPYEVHPGHGWVVGAWVGRRYVWRAWRAAYVHTPICQQMLSESDLGVGPRPSSFRTLAKIPHGCWPCSVPPAQKSRRGDPHPPSHPAPPPQACGSAARAAARQHASATGWFPRAASAAHWRCSGRSARAGACARQVSGARG